MTLYKFSGAGNDFVVLDGRGKDVSEYRDKERIGELCREYKTDGLMLLLESPEADFAMEFYNPDGSGGMMCGNGGRCIVAFADYLGLKPGESGLWRFMAPDGMHSASILSREGLLWSVRLKMIDVHGIKPVLGGCFLNTGTRHFVKFVPDVDAVDVEKEGKLLRWNPTFAPEGTNVNFVERCDGFLKIRTYEKGVEGETLACGTGITAGAIAAFITESASRGKADGALKRQLSLQCRRGDLLKVDFCASGEDFSEVHLTGPAELVKSVSL